MTGGIMWSIDLAVDNYLRSVDKFLDVIHTARKGQLHPSLLTSEQLEYIFKDIRDNSSSLGFPVPGP